jgi:transcriptional regulator of met regulon
MDYAEIEKTQTEVDHLNALRLSARFYSYCDVLDLVASQRTRSSVEQIRHATHESRDGAFGMRP